MLLKISAKTPEMFSDYLENIMNAACVICMGGYIPNEAERSAPQRRGRFWFRVKVPGSNCFHLYPVSNDYWANVQEEGEDFIVLRFRYRYDKGEAFANALTHLIAERFHYCAEII